MYALRMNALALCVAMLVPTVARGESSSRRLEAASVPVAGWLDADVSVGSAATPIRLSSSTPMTCPASATPGSARWAMFVLSAGDDPATVHFSPTGPSIGSTVYDTAGSPIVAQALLSSSFVPNPPSIQLSYSSPASGDSWLGIACYDTSAGGAVLRYWTSAITVDSTGGFTVGWKPTTPVVGPLAASDSTLVGSFAAEASFPPVTNFLVTASPTSGTTVSLTLPATASGFTLTGLVNGTDYAVTVAGVNSRGSTVSVAVHGSPVGAPFAPPTGVSVSLGPNAATVTWSPPVGETSLRTGYELTVVDVVSGAALAGSPFAVDAAATTATVSSLTAGVAYALVLQATYPAPFAGTPTKPITVIAQTSGDTSGTLAPVSTPAGLVLTQVCGRYGALPARPPSPSFPVAVAARPAAGVGVAPTASGGADNGFSQYPFPTTLDTAPTSSTNGNVVPAANYPTTCGLDFGEATLLSHDPVHLVTGDPADLSGQYFTATARLSQLSVVDVRTADAGWTVSAMVSDLAMGAGGDRRSFSGAHLGWDPVVTTARGPAVPGYSMQVSAGVSVEPMSPGLGSFRTLAVAAAGHGIGVAVLDAGLTMLLPVWAVSGTYHGTLTVTAL